MVETAIDIPRADGLADLDHHADRVDHVQGVEMTYL